MPNLGLFKVAYHFLKVSKTGSGNPGTEGLWEFA